jgi:hypothetical protein
MPEVIGLNEDGSVALKPEDVDASYVMQLYKQYPNYEPIACLNYYWNSSLEDSVVTFGNEALQCTLSDYLLE